MEELSKEAMSRAEDMEREVVEAKEELEKVLEKE